MLACQHLKHSAAQGPYVCPPTWGLIEGLGFRVVVMQTPMDARHITTAMMVTLMMGMIMKGMVREAHRSERRFTQQANWASGAWLVRQEQTLMLVPFWSRHSAP